MQRDTCIHSSMLIMSWIRKFVHMHQHKLMYALFLCLSHSVWKQRTFFKYFTHWFYIQCQSDQNDWYKFAFLLFVFQLKKTWSCWESWQAHQWMTEMTCLGLMWWLWRWVWTEHQIMFLQYWQIFLCENWTLRLPVGNVFAWWLSGNCVGVRGVFQWLLMWVYKCSLLAPVSWRILFFMVWLREGCLFEWHKCFKCFI